MSRRDKTRFEKWFSLSRHKRRSGAIELSDDIATNFLQQKKVLQFITMTNLVFPLNIKNLVYIGGKREKRLLII